MRRRELIAALLGGVAFSPPGRADDSLRGLIEAAGPVARRVLAAPEAFQLQVLLTHCERAGQGWRALSTQDFALRPRRWFAAASWVKLPLAALLVEELERRGLDWIDAGLRLEIDPERACAPLPAAQPGGWRLEALLQAMLVVSDNLAYNALYELLGSDAIHARLRALGFAHIRMATRLGCPQSRSPGKLGARLRDASGAVVWDSPAQPAETFQRFPFGTAHAGRAWAENGALTHAAHDFSDSNFLPLADVHRLVLELGGGIEPRFALSLRARRWFADTLALTPARAGLLSADQRAWSDDHSKWLIPLDSSGHARPGLSIASKNAQSFGYIGDSAFVTDAGRQRAFALTAVLFVDRDGVLNDGVYDYAGTGRPFLLELGTAALGWK